MLLPRHQSVSWSDRPPGRRSSDLLSVHRQRCCGYPVVTLYCLFFRCGAIQRELSPTVGPFGFFWLDPNRRPFDQPFAALVSADSARDAAGLFGKLQSLFDQPGDRVARQIRMLLPDGFCLLLPSTPPGRPGGGRPCEVACLLQCGGLVMAVHVIQSTGAQKVATCSRCR